MSKEIVVKTRRAPELEALRDRIERETGTRPTRRATVDHAIEQALVTSITTPKE